MFGLQKKSSSEENKNSSSNLSQKKNFNIEEAPIYTMREDLENIKKPAVSHGTISSPFQEKKPAIKQEIFTQKQRTSPFLSLNKENLPKTENLMNEKLPPLKTESAPVKLNFDTKKSSPAISKINWRLIFFFISSFSLIAVLITAGYYFSKNKIDLSDLLKNPFSSEPNIAPIVETPVEIETPITEPILSYSQTNPNYLKLEDSSLDAKAILQQYIQKVSQEGYTTPIEFVVTDQQNMPLAFSDFAAKIGLKLSRQIMENLGSNFSLFIYNDVSVTRIGLSIDLSMESKDSNKLAEALLQEEKTLADELNPLFFTTDYKTEKFFGNSEYAGIKIRFQNIISPDNLSVDYAIDKNKLLIGMTKLTLRAVIDHTNNIETTDSINNSTTKTVPATQE